MAIWPFAGRPSLVSRLLLVVALTLLSTFPVGVFLVVSSQLGVYRQATANELAMTLDTLERMVGEQAVIGDYALIEQILASRVRHGSFSRISYTDAEGRILSVAAPAPAQRYPAWFGRWFDLPETPVSRAIVIGGQPYGRVTVAFSHTDFRNQVWQTATEQVALFAGIALTLFVLVAWGLRQGLAPLRDLTRLARGLRQGEYQCLAIPPGRAAPELRDTLATFNDAASREAWLARFAEIVSSSAALAAKVEAVMRLLCLRLDMDAAVFAWVDETGEPRLATRWFAGHRPEGLDWQQPAREVVRRNAPLKLDERLPRAGRGVAEPGTYLGVPVAVGSHGMAVFSLFSRERRTLADHNGEVELAELCGGWIAAALAEEEQERQILEQKAHAETVLDNVSEGIATLDLGGVIVSANPAMGKIFGCGAEQLEGRSITVFVPDLHWHALAAHLARQNDTSRLSDMQWQAYGRRSDGARVLLELSARPVRHSGQWLVVAVMRDVTERVRAEEALRESEARRRHAQEMARLGSLEWFPKSGLIRCSPELDAIWGVAPGALTDLATLLSHVAPEERERVADAFEAAREAGRGFTTEFAVLTAGGERRSVMLSAEGPVPSDHGMHVFAVVQDVTERRQAEARLQAATLEKLQAEAHDRAKTLFLANMSHELRTPLNAIIGYSEMLQEEALAKGRHTLAEDLGKIHAAGTHLLAMINEVLDLSKIEAGRVELNLEEISIDPLLSEVLDTVRPLAEKQGNRLQSHVELSSPLMVTDATKLRQVLLNLLGNACKFTRDGEVTLDVAEEDREGDGIRFVVRDSGIGMTPEQIDRLFEPFVQADPSIARKYGGTGLGLAISKRFVTMLGGDITVDSAPHRGSVFAVWLPRQAVRPAQEDPSPPAIIEPDGRRQLDARDEGRRRRVATVMILERDPGLRALIARHASSEGFRVISVGRAEDAWVEARGVPPAVLVADGQVAGLSQLMESMRSAAAAREVPLILLVSEQDRTLARRLGPAEILPKPIPWQALAKALKKCVRRA